MCLIRIYDFTQMEQLFLEIRRKKWNGWKKPRPNIILFDHIWLFKNDMELLTRFFSGNSWLNALRSRKNSAPPSLTFQLWGGKFRKKLLSLKIGLYKVCCVIFEIWNIFDYFLFNRQLKEGWNATCRPLSKAWLALATFILIKANGKHKFI